MKKILLALLAIAFVASCSSGHDVIGDDPEDNTENTSPEEDLDTPDAVRYMLPSSKRLDLTAEQEGMVDGNNRFAFSLANYLHNEREAGNDKGKSMLVSPMGVSFVLGMLDEGASGEGQALIAKTLGMENSSVEKVSGLCKSLMTQLPTMDPNVKITFANALFCNKPYILNAEYEANVKASYDAACTSLDFASGAALSTINQWVSDKTGGLIPTALEEISPEAMFYLVNTLYYNATWTNQFDKARTTQEDFSASDGTKVRVAMMHNEALVGYSSTDLYDAVALGYGSGRWNMYVLLPAEGKTVGDVLNKISNATVKDIMPQMMYSEVALSLPKFSTSDGVSLVKAMNTMGLGSLFNVDSPLTGMFEGKTAVIGDMFQKSRIDVTEEGTQMTAVTVGAGIESDDLETGKHTFNANRPFVYVIADTACHAVLLVGTYTGK